MKTFPINLHDLSPRDVTFKLSQMPEATLTLSRWSLRVKAWAMAHYTPAGLKGIFEGRDVPKMAEICYYLLREKNIFPTQDSFFEAICGPKDELAILTAMLGTLGIGEPEIEKINKSLPEMETPDPNVPSPKPRKRKIGAKSSTP